MPDSTERAALLRRVQDDAAAVAQLAADLIAAPSENPPGDVTAAADVSRRWLDDRGLEYDLVVPAPGRENIVIEVDGAKSGPRVVLCAHLDTFPVGERDRWTVPPQAATVRDGAVYGRGASDMKGGAAAFLYVTWLASQWRDQLAGSLAYALVCDEESFGPFGARAVLEQRPELAGDAMLSTEPSSRRFVRFGEKGIVWGTATFEGPAGHAAYPSPGVSAIERASAFALDFASFDGWPRASRPAFDGDQRLRDIHDGAVVPGASDALDRALVNLGMIRGGAKRNLHAERCDVEVDVRLPVGASAAEAVTTLEHLVDRHGGRLDIELQSDPNATDPEHPLLDLVCENVAQVTGEQPLRTVGLGGTDSRLWRARGVPAAVFGPAPQTMGGPDELINIDELADITAVHAATVWDLLVERRPLVRTSAG
jgi:succinyl-diaminopimelate desuccinylase